jgi:hypothetical protein
MQQNARTNVTTSGLRLVLIIGNTKNLARHESYQPTVTLVHYMTLEGYTMIKVGKPDIL